MGKSATSAKSKGNKDGEKNGTSFQIRDIVLGKVRGYPAWPGMVVDPETAPENVKKERPQKSTSFYLVRFFPVGDYSWLPAREITPLKPYEIDACISEPAKKSDAILQGYTIAKDPKAWEEEMDAKAADAQEADAALEEDQLEDEDGVEAASTTKKRKRASNASTKEKKEKATKEKKASKKDGASTKKGASKKNGKKSKDHIESEDDEGVDGEEDGKGAPASKKAKKNEDEDEDVDDGAKLVREWRHRLQKAFLSQNKGAPKEEDMPGMDNLFTDIENYQKMTVGQLSFSKIGKVMRHIAAIEEGKIPRDDEYRFKTRAKSLVDKWHEILNEKKEDGDESKAEANGTHHEKGEVNGDDKKDEGDVSMAE